MEVEKQYSRVCVEYTNNLSVKKKRQLICNPYRKIGESWAVWVKICGTNFFMNQTSYDSIR